MNFTKHDALADELLASLVPYQDNYIKSYPVYFQGLKTHTAEPDKDTSADNLSAKPDEKLTSWSDTGLITKDLPFSVEVHEYVAPEGKGYQVLLYTKGDDKLWVRSIGYGPEAEQRTHYWAEVTNE